MIFLTFLAEASCASTQNLFFASIEAVRRGLDPLEAYIAVVSDLRRNGAVVLASSPRVKLEYNIKTGNRLFEIPKRSPVFMIDKVSS